VSWGWIEEQHMMTSAGIGVSGREFTGMKIATCVLTLRGMGMDRFMSPFVRLLYSGGKHVFTRQGTFNTSTCVMTG
jgi:hypothetical protein